METISEIIPKQLTGDQTGVTSKLKLNTRHDALLLFQAAVKRLLDINNWQKICGGSGAEFRLTDEKGEPIDGLNPKTGNLIRIKLPATQTKGGDGFDWFRIEEFEENKSLLSDSEFFGFRVHPVESPETSTGNSSHFYTNNATITFLIIRYSHTVFALEREKNEMADDSNSWINKIRNKLVAIAAKIGVSKQQWQKLVNGLLTPPN
jgi:hypothetical protein